MNDDLDFSYGNGVSPKEGCGVTLRGQFWYLGGTGSEYRRQVNQYANFKLKTIFQGEQNCWL